MIADRTKVVWPSLLEEGGFNEEHKPLKKALLLPTAPLFFEKVVFTDALFLIRLLTSKS
jgi:hydrogenase-4 membrane subunit HyfE